MPDPMIPEPMMPTRSMAMPRRLPMGRCSPPSRPPLLACEDSPVSIAIEGAVSGGLAAVGVRGELDIRSAPDLRAWLAKALDDGAVQLVIDLAEVDFMDS